MSYVKYSPFVLASGLAEVDVVHSAVNVVTNGLHLPQTAQEWGQLLGTFALVVFYKLLDYMVNRVAFRKIAVQESVNVAAAAPAVPCEEETPTASAPGVQPS